MSNYIVSSIFILFFSFGLRAQDSKEQIAFDYFLENIFFENYKREKSLYVSSNVESKVSIRLDGLFSNCSLIADYFGKLKFDNDYRDEIGKIQIPTTKKIQFLKNPSSRKLNLLIHESFNHSDIHFVYLTIFKENSFVDHYLIKIINNKVEDYCLAYEVI